MFARCYLIEHPRTEKAELSLVISCLLSEITLYSKRQIPASLLSGEFKHGFEFCIVFLDPFLLAPNLNLYGFHIHIHFDVCFKEISSDQTHFAHVHLNTFCKAVIMDCGELESEAMRTRKRKLEEAAGDVLKNDLGPNKTWDAWDMPLFLGIFLCIL